MKDVLDYYNRELDYLRKAGSMFAEKHPKVAQKLKIDDTLSPDPHTERLIESFAFLTSRINYKIDKNFSYMASALLDVLYPHYTRPIPAMSVAQCRLREEITEGVFVPKGTKFSAYSNQVKMNCIFQTVYDTTLFPISLTSAHFTHASNYDFDCAHETLYFRLSLSCENFNQNELLFYINAGFGKALNIYKTLFQKQKPKIFYAVDHKAHYLGDDVLVPMGFAEDETMLPVKYNGNHTYSLLQEFFTFAEKFMFFKCQNLDQIRDVGTFDLLIPCPHVDEKMIDHVDENDFLLNAVPIVNLFETTSDPIYLDHRQVDYLLSVNQKNDQFYEVYEVVSVHTSNPDINRNFEPFFGLYHRYTPQNIYWMSRRDTAETRGLVSSDVYLNFVTRDYLPIPEDAFNVYARVLATNRDLPADIQKGTLLLPDENMPLEETTFITHPRYFPYRYQPGEHMWKLVAQLSINQMSFSDPEHSLRALKEIILLHVQRTEDDGIVDSFKKITSKNIVKRFGVYYGFLKGIEISLHVTPLTEQSSGVFLMAAILRHYFAQNINMNSFLVVKLIDAETDQEITAWPPIAGNQKII